MSAEQALPAPAETDPLEERARRLVDGWPPFTPEQRARLAVLLAPGPRQAPDGRAPRAA